jgi:hypothetical protein
MEKLLWFLQQHEWLGPRKKANLVAGKEDLILNQKWCQFTDTVYPNNPENVKYRQIKIGKSSVIFSEKIK